MRWRTLGGALFFTLSASTFVVLGGGTAGADSSPLSTSSPTGEAYVDAHGAIVVVTTPGGGSGGGGGGGWTPPYRCVYLPASGLGLVPPPGARPGGNGSWFGQVCDVEYPPGVSPPIFWVWSQPAQLTLRQQAVSQVGFHTPVPRVDPPADAQLVGLRSWLWLGQTSLSDRRVASASLGGLTVTAAVRPLYTRWSFFDSSGFERVDLRRDCTPFGTPYRAGPAATTDCTTMLRSAPVAGNLVAVVSIHWRVDVSFASSGGARWTAYSVTDLPGVAARQPLVVRSAQVVIG